MSSELPDEDSLVPEREANVRKIRLTVEYDGTELHGWQRQLNGPTVQQHIEEALQELTGHATAVTGASRTDSGVHALGQVCHFETTSKAPLEAFCAGVNSKVPHAIAVVNAEHASEHFHARFDAKGKHYRYQIHNRAIRSPLQQRYSWHVRPSLDLPAMRSAAQVLVGEHNFNAFRKSDCQAKSPIRQITEIAIEQSGPTITIHVRGNSFLRNMVRIIAGTLVECGLGKFDANDVQAILLDQDRRRAGQTAPAQGLTLMSVLY